MTECNHNEAWVAVGFDESEECLMCRTLEAESERDEARAEVERLRENACTDACAKTNAIQIDRLREVVREVINGSIRAILAKAEGGGE